MSSNGRRRSARLLELEAKKKEQPTNHATADDSYQQRKKKVRTMTDKELGNSYPTNPLSGSSNVSAPWNTSSNLSGISVHKLQVGTMPDQELGNSYPASPLSGRSNVSAPWNTSNNLSGISVHKLQVRTMPDLLGNSYPANPLSGSSNVSAPWNTSSNLSGISVQAPDQHTGRFSFMNASCGDGNPKNVIPRAEKGKGLVTSEVRGADLRREYEKIYGVSPSAPGPGLWNFPVRPQQPNLYKPANQQGGNTSTCGTGRRVLQLSDIDEWFGSGRIHERTNSGAPTDNSEEQSANRNCKSSSQFY